MKTTAILLLMLLMQITATGQNVNIPDNNFKQRLIILGVDQNGDGEISFDEAAVPVSLDISPAYGLYVIEDVTGIEAFVNLDTLVCNGNDIVTLDSVRYLPLRYLDCHDNNIDALNFVMPDLEQLIGHNNTTETLDAALFPALQYLKCSPAVSLNVANNALTDLYVTSEIPIDVTQAPALRVLECRATSPPDLGNNPLLEHLRIDSQGEQITSINLSGNPNLEYLFINADLTTIDLTGNPNLTHIDLRQNYLSQLDLSNNTQLSTLVCFDNQLESLDLSNNTQLTSVLCYQNNLTALNLSNLTNLETLSCLNNQLTSINLHDNAGLKSLYICYNQFETVDVSQNAALETFYCIGNQLQGTLDLSGNPNLKKINCSENQLTSLDLTHNPALEEAWCQQNNLSLLDVSGLTILHDLHFFQNEITFIDLSSNTGLTFMQCGYNPVDSLDLSYNTNLQTVHFTEMPLLVKVCVSQLPVPFEYTATGSPDITFGICSFTDIATAGIRYPEVAPNPTNGLFSVRNVAPGARISLYSSNGRLLFESATDEAGEVIDIHDAPPGMYLLRIFSGGRWINKKIIKQ